MGARRGVEQAPLRYQLVLVLRKAAHISGYIVVYPVFCARVFAKDVSFLPLLPQQPRFG